MVQRMRQFALAVSSARGIRFELRSPEAVNEMIARSDVRRQVSLVFKESINNAIRHSGGTEVRAGLDVRGGFLILTIADNGKGFDASRVSQGRGLRSMTERARELGGELKVESEPGAGVAITLRVPLRPPGKRRILHKHVADGMPPAH
jgi:signal transduction histidine kinase